MMKILIVSYQNNLLMAGGAQQVAHDEFVAALRGGHEVVHLCVLDQFQLSHVGGVYDQVLQHEEHKNVYNIVPRNYDFDLFDCTSSRYLASFLTFACGQMADVVHFHHYHRVGLNTIVELKKRLPHTPICLTLHEMLAICMADGQMRRIDSGTLCSDVTGASCSTCFPDRNPHFFSIREEHIKGSFSAIDCFVFPSEFLRLIYEQWGLPQHKCHVIPNGQPGYISRNYNSQHSPALNRFGFFGQLIENKGLHQLLDALELVSPLFPNISLDINASKPGFSGHKYSRIIDTQIRKLVTNSELNLTVNYRGSYNRSDLQERMCSVDWVIIPSIWPETFALVLSEAWAYGRPVLTADIGALSLRVRNRIDGMKYNPFDTAELSRLLVAVNGNIQLWSNLNRHILSQSTDSEMLNLLLKLWKTC